MTRRRTIVVLGMMTKMPVAGVVWQTLHYLVGFRRIGFDVLYVEAHARTPSMFCAGNGDDGSRRAAAFIASVMQRFDLGSRWAYHALHSDGRCYGLEREALQREYESAEMLVNLHGGTMPREEHARGGRLVYLGTDPVQLEVELFHGNEDTIRFLDAHCCHFTFGENYGRPDCGLPVTSRFHLEPTRQPVVMDFWDAGQFDGDSGRFTTIGNWRQPWRDIRYRGQSYSWSKHHEFEKILDLPRRTESELELALSSFDETDRKLLEGHGWKVRDALSFSSDLDAYRRYVTGSRGELTVAKDQNVRFRSGWFSDRSATYLAAGRPVVTQDTGFGSVLPTGRGLFAFSDAEGAVDALEKIEASYPDQRRAAREVARDFFDHEIVLGALLRHVGLAMERPSTRAGDAPQHPVADGLAPGGACRGAADVEPFATEEGGGSAASGERARPAGAPGSSSPLRDDLPVMPVSRRPTRLPGATLAAVEAAGVPVASAMPRKVGDEEPPRVSIVMVTHDQLPFTQLAVTAVLENTAAPSYELLAFDNGSRDGTPGYLRAVAEAHRHIRVTTSPENLGFAVANNRAIAGARGEFLVLLNNDTIVTPGWLPRLLAHLEVADVGAVGPVTNRIGNEAEVEVGYTTYGGLVEEARERARTRAGRGFEIPTLTMFCFAIRKATWERIGILDERYEVGMLEDDDYSVRITRVGLRLVCAEDVLIHHFGQASFGALVPSGEYGRVLEANRRRFAEKWGHAWQPYDRRISPEYEALTARIRTIVARHVPDAATVLVVSRGDDRLLELGRRRGWHVPRTDDGTYAGFYPGDSDEAIAHVESLRALGGDYLLFPRTSGWWLDFYAGLREHLDRRYRAIVRDSETCTLYALHPGDG